MVNLSKERYTDLYNTLNILADHFDCYCSENMGMEGDDKRCGICRAKLCLMKDETDLSLFASIALLSNKSNLEQDKGFYQERFAEAKRRGLVLTKICKPRLQP